MGSQDKFTCQIANYSATSLSYSGDATGQHWANGKYTTNPVSNIDLGSVTTPTLVTAFATESDWAVGTTGYVIYDLGTGRGQLVVMYNNPSTKSGSGTCDNCWVYAVITGPTTTLACYVEISGFDMQLDPPANNDVMSVTVSVYDSATDIVSCPTLNDTETAPITGIAICRCYISVLATQGFITLNGLTNGIDPLPNTNLIDDYCYGNPPLVVPMIHTSYGEVLAFEVSGGYIPFDNPDMPYAAGNPNGAITYNLPDTSILKIAYNTVNESCYQITIEAGAQGAQGYTATSSTETTTLDGNTYYDLHIQIDYNN